MRLMYKTKTINQNIHTEKSLEKLGEPSEGGDSHWHKLVTGKETNCAGGATQFPQFILQYCNILGHIKERYRLMLVTLLTFKNFHYRVLKESFCLRNGNWWGLAFFYPGDISMALSHGDAEYSCQNLFWRLQMCNMMKNLFDKSEKEEKKVQMTFLCQT